MDDTFLLLVFLQVLSFTVIRASTRIEIASCHCYLLFNRLVTVRSSPAHLLGFIQKFADTAVAAIDTFQYRAFNLRIPDMVDRP